MTQNTPENQPQNPPENQQNTGPATVALDDATIQRIADASSRQAAQNVNNGSSQQQQSTQQDNNGAQGNHQGQSGDAVLTAIQALPEQITRSIKEALQPPSSSGNQGAQSNNSGQALQQGSQQQSGEPSGQQEPNKKRSFAEWWFQK